MTQGSQFASSNFCIGSCLSWSVTLYPVQSRKLAVLTWLASSSLTVTCVNSVTRDHIKSWSPIRLRGERPAFLRCWRWQVGSTGAHWGLFNRAFKVRTEGSTVHAVLSQNGVNWGTINHSPLSHVLWTFESESGYGRPVAQIVRIYYSCLSDMVWVKWIEMYLEDIMKWNEMKWNYM